MIKSIVIPVAVPETNIHFPDDLCLSSMSATQPFPTIYYGGYHRCHHLKVDLTYTAATRDQGHPTEVQG